MLLASSLLLPHTSGYGFILLEDMGGEEGRREVKEEGRGEAREEGRGEAREEGRGETRKN